MTSSSKFEEFFYKGLDQQIIESVKRDAGFKLISDGTKFHNLLKNMSHLYTIFACSETIRAFLDMVVSIVLATDILINMPTKNSIHKQDIMDSFSRMYDELFEIYQENICEFDGAATQVRKEWETKNGFDNDVPVVFSDFLKNLGKEE